MRLPFPAAGPSDFGLSLPFWPPPLLLPLPDLALWQQHCLGAGHRPVTAHTGSWETNRDTSGASGLRPGHKHRWIKPEHPPAHHRGKKGDRRKRTIVRRKPRHPRERLQLHTHVTHTHTHTTNAEHDFLFGESIEYPNLRCWVRAGGQLSIMGPQEVDEGRRSQGPRGIAQNLAGFGAYRPWIWTRIGATGASRCCRAGSEV